MSRIMNPKWTAKMTELYRTCNPIDEVVDNSMAAKWLIVFLSEKNATFKIVNLGAGVRRITTVMDECPMCKRKLY